MSQEQQQQDRPPVETAVEENNNQQQPEDLLTVDTANENNNNNINNNAGEDNAETATNIVVEVDQVQQQEQTATEEDQSQVQQQLQEQQTETTTEQESDDVVVGDETSMMLNNNNGDEEEQFESFSPAAEIDAEMLLQQQQEEEEQAQLQQQQEQEQKKHHHKKSKTTIPDGFKLGDIFGSFFQPQPPPENRVIPPDPGERDIEQVMIDMLGEAAGAGNAWKQLVFIPVENQNQNQVQQQVQQQEEELLGELSFKEELNKLLESELKYHYDFEAGLDAQEQILQVFGVEGANVISDAFAASEQQQKTKVVERAKIIRQPKILSLPRLPVVDFGKMSSSQQQQQQNQNQQQQQQKQQQSNFDPFRQNWLLHLPTIYPARRSCHIERHAYTPGYTKVKQQSNDYSIYTPLNVVRWAHDPNRNVDMSNARLVKWASGSWTLHIGTDTYKIGEDKTTNLVVVGKETENKAPEFAPSSEKKLFVETAPYTVRAQLLPVANDSSSDTVNTRAANQSLGHSVEDFLVAENRIKSSKPVENQLKAARGMLPASRPNIPGMTRKELMAMENKRNEGDVVAQYLTDRERNRETTLKNELGRNPTTLERMEYDADSYGRAQKLMNGELNHDALMKEERQRLDATTQARMHASRQQLLAGNMNAGDYESAAAGKNIGNKKKGERDLSGIEGGGEGESESGEDEEEEEDDFLVEDDEVAREKKKSKKKKEKKSKKDKKKAKKEKKEQKKKDKKEKKEKKKHHHHEEEGGETTPEDIAGGLMAALDDDTTSSAAAAAAGNENEVEAEKTTRRRSREAVDQTYEEDPESQQQRNKNIERAENLARTPGISEQVRGDIESLVTYFQNTPAVSLETMAAELKKAELDLVKEAP